MAVSARFLADFTQFNAAVQSAQVRLKDFTTGSAQVEKQLSRMTDSFSGRPMIQQATLAAEAIERIGGTSKLTENELRKVSAQAQEAAAKLRAMGQDVPEKLQRLASAADEGGKKVGLLQKAAALAGPALTAMVGTFTVGAIISAIRNTGEWAGRVDDLSKKMGVSVEAVQRLDFAARKSGASIEGISTAMVFLSRQLVGGDKGTVEALGKLNLTIEDLRRLAPEQQFIKIANAVALMTDQNEKNATTTALLGRGAADLIPIFGTLEKDMGEAVVANKSMIEAGDRLGDSWDKLMGAGTALLAGVLVPIEPALTKAADATGSFAQKMFDLSEASSRVLNRPGLLSRSGLGLLQDISKELHNIDVARMAGNVASPGLRTGSPLSGLGPTDAEIRDIERNSRELQKSFERTGKAVKEVSTDIEISSKAFDRWWGLMQAMPPSIRNTSDEINRLRQVIAGANIDVMAKLIGAAPGSISSQGISQTLAQAQNAWESFFGGIRGGVQSIWQGMSGGGGLSGLFGNLGGGLVEGFGNLLSGGITSLISGGLNAAVKGVGSLFGKLFGGDSKELKAAKQAFAAIQQEAARLGITLDQTFKLKSVEDYQRAIERAQAKINGFMDEQAADQERLQKAIEKYGFTFEQLGPTLQRQRLHEQATELIEDWRVLVAAGIDLTTVNQQMAASINEYLKLAIRTGMEVPRAFEPILQQMIEQGLLLDENGNAITDLGQLQIKWSETMTQGFDRVVQKLQELIDKLQATGKAISDIPRNVDVDVNYRENFPGGGGGGRPQPIDRPALSLTGETLATVDKTTSGGGGGGGVGTLVVNMDVDGERMATKVVKLMPDRLALMGVR